ncbi:MAG: hypothetical protein ACR2PH_17010 [Desulfobulbia bacterium]
MFVNRCLAYQLSSELPGLIEKPRPRLLILAIIFEIVALSASIIFAAVQDTTSVMTGRTFKPFTAGTEVGVGLGELDKLIDVLTVRFVVAAGTVDQANATRSGNKCNAVACVSATRYRN